MIDQEKIEQAVRLMLEGIGEDVSREGLKDTPARISRMCGELYSGSQTVTIAKRGLFETDPSLEERFFRMMAR